MLICFRHADLSFLIFSQDYYELPTKTIRAKCNNDPCSKANNFTSVQSLYQDEALVDMTLNECKLVTSTC